MAEFYVIYFDYDQQFNSVAKTKVKLETLEIGDDGKEVYITENYKGTIICIGQVKRKATEIAEKCQKEMQSGLSLDQIILEHGTINRKRDSAGKMAAAILELQENATKKPACHHTLTEPEAPSKTKKAKQSRKKQPVQEKTSNSTLATKPAIHPEKLAEMMELVGGDNAHSKNSLKSVSCSSTSKKSSPQKQISLKKISPKKQSSATTQEPPTKLESNLSCQKTPNKLERKTSTSNIIEKTTPSDKLERKSSTPKKIKNSTTKTDEFQPNFASGSDPQNFDPNSTIAYPITSFSNQLIPTRFSPRKHVSNVSHYLSSGNDTYMNLNTFENISPVKTPQSRWDGTFVQSSEILLDMDQHDHGDGYNLVTTNPEETNVMTSSPKEVLCNILAISSEEAYVAGRILNRIAGVLMEGSVHEHRDNSCATSFLSTNASFADMSSSSCLETELPSKSIQEENLGLLIKDPNNPGKFDSVLVDKIKERQAIIQAESSKKPAMTLLNSILGCVFKDEELANSSGLGLRKSGDDKKPPLNKLKVDAVRGYITHYCKKNQWEELSVTDFNKVVTNKVTNKRKKLYTSPKLKHSRTLAASFSKNQNRQLTSSTVTGEQ